jgi:galactokinase
VTGGEGEPLTGGEDAPVTGREGEPFTGREGAPVTRGEGAPVTGREDATVTGAAQAAPVVPARLAEAAGTGAEVAFRAPGRANLIGEHTDYNDGFVLPLALEAATWVCGRRVDGVARLRSLEQPGEVEVDLASGDGPEQGWGRYVTAVVRALRDAGVALRGFEGVLASDVPIGAGLSSSAALEMAVAWALLAEERPAHELARICQRAENRYVGVRSGIMDQLASAAGRPGQALLIDCRSLELEPVPVPDTLRVVLLDSAVQRQLGDSAYNERRAQCEQAAAALGVAALRDADPELLEAHAAELDPVVYRRARHVVTENARVLEAAAALRQGRVGDLGQLFAAAHQSMAEDYEASVPEVDALVRLAGETPGVLAARLTGAGFGGCTVNLVEAGRDEAAAAEILDRYRAETGRQGRWWSSRPAAGAGPAALPGS